MAITPVVKSSFRKQSYFNYEPLDQLHDSFRIIKLLPGPLSAPIECILTNERISSMEYKYDAVSYTWGKPATPRWIRLNQVPYMVQPNLLEAFRGIRSESEELLVWADVICINQTDITERNHQVGLMGNIHSKAKRVRMWLGPAADDSDFVLDYIQREVNNFRREKVGEKTDPVSDKEKEAFIKAFSVFHRRPYWDRAWIKHEVSLANDLVVHCGTKAADGLRLLVLAVWHHQMDGGFSDQLPNIDLHRINRVDHGREEPFELVFQRFWRSSCTDPRDRIFSILSLAADTQGIEHRPADYSLDLPALFFAIIAPVEPRDLLSFTTTLHEALGVHRSQLVEYWEKVGAPDGHRLRTTTTKAMKNAAVAYVCSLKAIKKKFESMTSRDWLTQLKPQEREIMINNITEEDSDSSDGQSTKHLVRSWLELEVEMKDPILV
ncbi:heterokaryon incompatibility protein-domain-containing protein [Podospora fimiseda]|uniref:Heterokaryon incompatibility protein-domain-containing protein n=1 Tax=Podospora fimiseda TaxID=252190 RepID=A0AAN7BLP9_9PEZI|nr:heterokaryon incompatibility protein-domain-containing protein [Podospora fimiseda]